MTVLSPEETGQNLPGKNDVLKLNPNKPTSEIKLKSAEWQIILQIDGNKKVQEIVDILGTDAGDVLLSISNLYQKGLILTEISKQVPAIEYVDEEFFKVVESTLVHHIGPVAPYVISDVLLELEIEKDKFSKDNVPMLIESISQEIMDEGKRVQFQKEMLGYIKKI